MPAHSFTVCLYVLDLYSADSADDPIILERLNVIWSNQDRLTPRRARGAGFIRRAPASRPRNPSWQAAHWHPVPTAAREGLSLRALSDEELNDKLAHHVSWDPARDEKWWTVEYTKKSTNSKSVKDRVFRRFFALIVHVDPNGFHGLLEKFPWHGDTLV
jgi:hypothetical protein